MKMMQDLQKNQNILIKKPQFSARRGSGSLILGAIMMLVCFVMILAIMRVYEIQNVDAHSQVVCDAISNSAVVYGQDCFDVDEDMIIEGVNTLIAANSSNLGGASNRITFALSEPVKIEKTLEREYFNDKKVTVKMNSSYVSPLRSNDYVGEADYSASSASEIIAYAEVPINTRLSAQDAKAIAYAVAHAPGPLQKNAILKGATMIGWLYPTDANQEKGWSRWTTKKNSDGNYYGCRDCSSFVITAFQDYTYFFGGSGGYTQTIREKGFQWGCILKYGKDIPLCKNSEEFFNQLQIGDIFLITGRTDRTDGISHTGIYIGQGKILHSTGGGVHIENWPKRYHYWHGPYTSHKYDLIYIVRIPQNMYSPNAHANNMYAYYPQYK